MGCFFVINIINKVQLVCRSSKRAIENLCYVAGINRTGTDGNKVDHNGFSMVLGPKGETKCILEKDAELMEVSLFHDELQSFRKKFSVLNDRDSFMIAY